MKPDAVMLPSDTSRVITYHSTIVPWPTIALEVMLPSDTSRVITYHSMMLPSDISRFVTYHSTGSQALYLELICDIANNYRKKRGQIAPPEQCHEEVSTSHLANHLAE